MKDENRAADAGRSRLESDLRMTFRMMASSTHIKALETAPRRVRSRRNAPVPWAALTAAASVVAVAFLAVNVTTRDPVDRLTGPPISQAPSDGAPETPLPTHGRTAVSSNGFAEFSGTLLQDTDGCVVLRAADGGTVRLLWPEGFTVRASDLSIRSDGEAVARIGEESYVVGSVGDGGSANSKKACGDVGPIVEVGRVLP